MEMLSRVKVLYFTQNIYVEMELAPYPTLSVAASLALHDRTVIFVEVLDVPALRRPVVPVVDSLPLCTTMRVPEEEEVKREEEYAAERVVQGVVSAPHDEAVPPPAGFT